MKRLSFSLFFILIIFTGTSSQGGTILVEEEFLIGQNVIALFQPVGQSFTAENTNVTIALSIAVQNALADSTDPLTFSLFEGDGFDGALLDAQSFVVPATHSGWYEVDYSSTDLEIGHSYTIGLSVAAGSPYWGVYSTSGDPYSGGQGYLSGAPSSDLFLLVTPKIPDIFEETPPTIPVPIQNTSVPEPGTMLLFGTGLACLSLARGKRK